MSDSNLGPHGYTDKPRSPGPHGYTDSIPGPHGYTDSNPGPYGYTDPYMAKDVTACASSPLKLSRYCVCISSSHFCDVTLSSLCGVLLLSLCHMLVPSPQ